MFQTPSSLRMGDSAGRFNILSQMEHLQSKYMGTGHADTTKYEWAAHQHRWGFATAPAESIAARVPLFKRACPF